MGKNRFSVKQG